MGEKNHGTRGPHLGFSGLSDKLAGTCFSAGQQWHLMAAGQHCRGPAGTGPGPPGGSLSASCPPDPLATPVISGSFKHDNMFFEALLAYPRAHPTLFSWGVSWCLLPLGALGSISPVSHPQHPWHATVQGPGRTQQPRCTVTSPRVLSVISCLLL